MGLCLWLSFTLMGCFCWFCIITHHGLVHSFRLHVVKLIKIWLFCQFISLLFLVLSWLLQMDTMEHFWLGLGMFFFFILDLVKIWVVVYVFLFSCWMLNILVGLYDIFGGGLKVLVEVVWMLRWLWLVAHHGLVHFLWFHVVELIKVLFRCFLLLLVIIHVLLVRVRIFLGLSFGLDVDLLLLIGDLVVLDLWSFWLCFLFLEFDNIEMLVGLSW